MKALVERFGDRIWLRTSAPTPGLSARIKGAYFRKTEKAWTFPLRLDVCRMLRDEFGKGLEIGDVLEDWARAEVSRESTLGALGSTLTAVELTEVPRRYPRMDKALSSRPYQSVAARFIAEGRNVLLADTPGLGKTLEAMAGVVESGVEGPFLVVCPVSVLDDAWARSIERWMPDQDVFVARGSHAKRADAISNGTMYTNGWVIVNHAMLRTVSWWICPVCEARWKASDKPKSAIVNCGHESKNVKTVHEHVYPELFYASGIKEYPMKWGAVILDESQDITVRLSGTPTQTRNGARLLQVRPDGLRIACSGTPMRGKSHQLWGTLNWLRPKEFTGFWSWAESYYHVESAGPFGGMNVGLLRDDRAGHMDKMLSGVMLRRTKAEVSPELPPKQYMGSPLDPRDENSPIAVWLPMTPEQARASAEMVRSGAARIKGGELNAVGALAELTRLQQFASSYGKMSKSSKFKPALPSNKLQWIEQFLRELGIIDPDHAPGAYRPKVVIVSRFTSILRTFAIALMEKGVKVAGITGSVTGKRRQEVVDEFNRPDSDLQVLFLNTKAGGVGITLDAADDMVFLDQTHRPDDQEQAEERINNRRPEEKVATRRYWYLRSIGTVDEGIARVNASLDEGQKDLLDKRRGVAYASAVFDYLEG